MNDQIKKRMVNAEFKLLDKNRQPLRNQPVTVEQTNHQFLFGTANFDLVPLANNEHTGSQLELSQIIADKTLALCNAITLPFYWGMFEPVQGQTNTARIRKTAQWCKERGIKLKGHPLCWHTICADWLLTMSNEDILKTQLARIHRDVSEFRDLIDMWDVINEAVIMPIFDKYDNGITRICKELGRINLIRKVFEAARSENPTATLLINDFETSPAYDILIEGCLEAGIKFDVIGIQSHMHQGWWGLEKTHEILERFGRFNIPLHFTETTLISGELMPPEIVDLNDYQVTDWPTRPDLEERQVCEVVQHYETLFANPLVQSINWWDIYDGCWLNAPSGLLRKDGSSKPAYDELLKRVKGEWWLPATQFSTDDQGKLRFSGFPGTYEVTLNGQKTVVTLSAGQEKADLQL